MTTDPEKAPIAAKRAVKQEDTMSRKTDPTTMVPVSRVTAIMRTIGEICTNVLDDLIETGQMSKTPPSEPEGGAAPPVETLADRPYCGAIVTGTMILGGVVLHRGDTCPVLVATHGARCRRHGGLEAAKAASVAVRGAA